MIIQRVSPISGKLQEMDIDVTQEHLDAFYKGGKLIQHAMPHITAAEREFILTGITDEEWNEAFPEEEEEEESIEDAKMYTHRFYKENGMWYIDLPEFLEKKLGTKNNLLMVGGSDVYLDRLSENGTEVTISFSKHPFENYSDVFERYHIGKDQEYLDSVGHAPVDSGAYYVSLVDSAQIWLCPVTKYVFGSDYPKIIYLKKQS